MADCEPCGALIDDLGWVGVDRDTAHVRELR